MWNHQSLTRRAPLLGAGILCVLAPMIRPLAAQAAPMHWTPFTFTSAAGDTVRADSGRVVVPERRSRANGPTISIAVVRIPSTAARPGNPVIYLAGGPGGAGIAGVRGDLFPTVLALRAVSDVILFDQRGTGFTQPSLVVRSTFGVPLTLPSASPAAMQALIASSRAAAAEIKARGIDLAAYNTLENADDVEDIRKAIGASRLIVWGHSYGSHLGLAYLRRHSSSTERAILGGINGVDQRRRMPKDADELFARIDSLVRNTPKLNKVMPDFLGSAKRVFAKLAANPVIVRVDSQDVLVSKEDVQAVIAVQSGEQGFVRRLPWYIGLMEAGDFSAMARLVRDVIKNRPIGTAMTYAMDLASGASAGRSSRIRGQVAGAILGNAINYPFDHPEFRDAWAPSDLGAAFRASVKSSVPTLFLSGTLDGRTSLRDAEEVRGGFRNNAHAIIAGASHNPYAVDPALRDIMVRFASGGRVRDTVITLRNVELRGPDETGLVADLQRAAAGGPEAAARRLGEFTRDDARYVSSFVILGAIQALAATNREAAGAILVAGVALFPGNSALLARLGDMHVARGEVTAARDAYERAVAADTFNQQARAQLAKLPAGR